MRRYVEALIDYVVDLAPAMRARISLDDTQEEVTDEQLITPIWCGPTAVPSRS